MPARSDVAGDKPADPKLYDVKVRSLWGLLLFGLTIVYSLLLVPIFALLGLTQANISVFAVLAGVSGILADLTIRRRFKAAIVITETPRLPVIPFWLAFCTLLGVLGPERLQALVLAIASPIFRALNSLLSG